MNSDNHLVVGWWVLGASSTFRGRGKLFAIIGIGTLDHAACSIFAITPTLLRLRVKTLHVLHDVYEFRCYHFNTYLQFLITVTVLHICALGSSVAIATDYRPDGPGIESRWGRDFPHPSIPALGPGVPGFSRG